MSDITSVPPIAVPPVAPLHPHAPLPLGEGPLEREPISTPFAAVDAILRQPRRVMFQLRQTGAGRLTLMMLAVTLVCSLIYGLVMGTFSMGDQVWQVPVKVACGLLISGLICLPSLYIFTCLSGSQARLSEVCGLVAGLMMLATLLLVGFAPVAWLFSQSTESLTWMGSLHIAFWFISSFFALRFLETAFSHSKARSNAGLNTWMLIFLLVTLQMTTALRPLIGKSDLFLPKEKKFFVTLWMDSLNKP